MSTSVHLKHYQVISREKTDICVSFAGCIGDINNKQNELCTTRRNFKGANSRKQLHELDSTITTEGGLPLSLKSMIRQIQDFEYHTAMIFNNSVSMPASYDKEVFSIWCLRDGMRSFKIHNKHNSNEHCIVTIQLNHAENKVKVPY